MTDEIEAMFGAFPLNQTLARNSLANPDDILNTKRGLHRLGYYTPPSGAFTTWTDDDMFDGVTRFQRDHGLMKDGELRKGGETAKTLGASLGTALVKRRQAQNPLREPDEPPTEELDDNKADTRLNLFGPGHRGPRAEDKERNPTSSPTSPPSSLYAASFTLPTAATNTALTERRDAERKARIASRKKAARFLGKLVKTGMTALSSSLAQARQPEPQTPCLEDYQFTRGLKVDGIMNKGGETERALTLDLRQNDIPDDPGQDDPEEPSGPSEPSEPKDPKDDEDKGNVFTGPCADEAWALRKAQDETVKAYEDVKVTQQRINEIEDEIQALEEEMLAKSGESPSAPNAGRDSPKRRSDRISADKIFKNLTPIGRIISGAQSAAELGRDATLYINFQDELEKLKAELEQRESDLEMFNEVYESAKVREENALEALRRCLAENG